MSKPKATCIIPDKDEFKHGVYETYYSNGKLKSEETFIWGKPDGLHKIYKEDGSLYMEFNYYKGKYMGAYRPHQRKNEECNFGILLENGSYMRVKWIGTENI